MCIKRTLPALCVLAAIMLAGLPRQARADDTLRLATGLGVSITGRIDMYAGVGVSDSARHETDGVIGRGYFENNLGLCHPLTVGFCLMSACHLDRVPTSATLHYYQTGHQGSAALSVNWMSSIVFRQQNWFPSDTDRVFWSAWNDDPILTTDVAHSTDNAWYSASFTNEGLEALYEISQDGITIYPMGWTYRDFEDSTYADVAGYDDDHKPYIVIVP
jgi:hypothetical protein